jgi:hypothetical protein
MLQIHIKLYMPAISWLHSCHLLWERQSDNLIGSKDVAQRRPAFQLPTHLARLQGNDVSVNLILESSVVCEGHSLCNNLYINFYFLFLNSCASKGCKTNEASVFEVRWRENDGILCQAQPCKLQQRSAMGNVFGWWLSFDGSCSSCEDVSFVDLCFFKLNKMAHTR